MLRRGLLTGTEKLNGQLRDAAEGGQREETEVERAQNSARTATQKAVNRLEKSTHKKKKARNGKSETHTGTGRTGSDVSSSDIQTERAVPSGSAESVQSKSKDAVRRAPSAEHSHMDSDGFEPSQIKTKDARIQPQTANPNHGSAATSDTPSKEQTSCSSQQGHQKIVRERAQDISTQQPEGQRRLDQTVTSPMREPHGGNTFRQTTGTDHRSPASKPDGQQYKPLEQGRQKNILDWQKNAAESIRRSERPIPTRLRDAGDVRPGYTSTRSVPDGKGLARNAARKTIPDGKRRIKEARSGVKTVGRTSRKAVKGAESSGKALKAGGRSVQAMRQTAQAAVQIRQRAVQAANAAQRMAKAAAAALRGAVAAVRSLAPLLAAGGGTVFAVVLVLCMAGAILASPLGIFFSLFGGNSGGGQQQTTVTISAVVQDLNQEYDARLDEIRANASYHEESLIGSPAPWPEVLAVYAVKTATDPANEQEVVTMTDEKKVLLEQIFWDMNGISSFTSTVPGEGDAGSDTTTLYITVTAKTADEMADIYGFNDDQRHQLAELLSDEYREMWNDAL